MPKIKRTSKNFIAQLEQANKNVKNINDLIKKFPIELSRPENLLSVY